MRPRRSWRRIPAAAATVIAVVLSGSTSRTQAPPPLQTLCVLDFHRLGNDGSVDWLEQGLADMMIGVLRADSPYLVIERRHLREILHEHGLAERGVVDVDNAVRRAQLARAHLLLLGSFARQRDVVTIQVRLIRLADQHLVAQVTWSDRYDNVLAAPRVLTSRLQAALGHSTESSGTIGLEALIPRTIDAAESFYRGVRAFDDGRYPEALAHYLDASRPDGDFRKAPAAALDLYYLLGRSEHAVLFARERARSAERRGDAPEAVEYYFAAARELLDPLGDPRSASEALRQLLGVIDRQDRRTREIAGTRRAILHRIDHLNRQRSAVDPDRIGADREIRQRVWTTDIDSELARRSEEEARGGYAVLENGKWVKRLPPEPSMLMWRVRARWTLARAYARSGRADAALDQYRELLAEYEFLPPATVARLRDSIRTEAHFMMLRHHRVTGRLIRDHAVNRINRLNVVRRGDVFTRDFGATAAPDARARVASRSEDRGHEYFDFASPPGQQIDALTLRIDVRGTVRLGFNLPDPTGWPPQYSFSRRFDHVTYAAPGRYERTIVPPPGTEFLSVGTSWGPGREPGIVKWEVAFTVSPKASGTRTVARSLIDRYALGWDRGQIVRDGDTRAYLGEPGLNAAAAEWLVFSMRDDIRIVHRRDLAVELELPVAINSREREFDASLVPTHDGRHALLWARGTSPRHATRFVAFSPDLRRWSAPQRLVFEAPPESIGYTYGQAEPLERSYNVVAVRGGYLMLLAQGFSRFSKDLRNWERPRRALPQDLHRNHLLEGPDGVVWAVYETSSSRLQPYTDADWLHGFIVVGGKRYRHVTELRVSRSVDGVVWEPAGDIAVPGQPSGLWAFAIDERRIGIAAGFNNLSMRWFSASSLGAVQAIDADVRLPNHADGPSQAAFFVHDEGLTCVRPVFSVESQEPVLLAVTSGRLFR